MARAATRNLAVISMLFLPAHPCAAGSDPRPEDLLARYDAFLDAIRTIRFDCVETAHLKGGPYADWTWAGTERVTFARTDAGWRWQGTAVGTTYHRGGLFNLYYGESEKTFDGTAALLVSRSVYDENKPAAFDEKAGQERLNRGLDRAAETRVSTDLGTERDIAARDYGTWVATNVLYGHLPLEDLFVSEAMRQGSTRMSSRVETLDGRTLYVLEGRTRHGVLTLWLDPASGHAPVRLRQEKSGSDLVGDTPVDQSRPHGNPGKAEPNLPLRGVDYQVDFRPMDLGGRRAIASYSLQLRRIYEGGSDYTRRRQGKFENIRFDPKPAELERTIPIPEGTKVEIVSDVIRARAIWAGGGVVVDPSSLPRPR